MLSFLLTSNIIQSYILIFKSTRREFRPQRRMLVRFRQELKRCHGARALIYSLRKSKTGFTGCFWRKAAVAIVNAGALEAPRRRPFNEGMGEGR
jgi:hypothetical protein